MKGSSSDVQSAGNFGLAEPITMQLLHPVSLESRVAEVIPSGPRGMHLHILGHVRRIFGQDAAAPRA